jgi:hypothetical protein
MSDFGSYEDGLMVAHRRHRPFSTSGNATHKAIQCTQFSMDVIPRV